MKEKEVKFADIKLKEAFGALKTGKFANPIIYKAISKILDKLKQNPEHGIRIPKKLIPKEYIEKYEIDNLWKCNLPNAWRLLYTITATEIKIISVVLNWMDHKNYSRLFKYKK